MNNGKTFLMLLCAMPLQAGISREWAHSRASKSAQEGNWKDAQLGIRSLLVDEPNRPDLLYDAGVAAYSLKEFEKADAYFTAAAEQKNVDAVLKKQALFNLGNTKVARKQLQDALDVYERLLEMDPQNEKAKHNRDTVKKMLEEDDQDGLEKDDDGDEKMSDDEGDEQAEKRQKNDSSGTEKEEEQASDEQQDGQHDDESANKPDNQDADEKKDQGSDGHDSSSEETNSSKQKESKPHDIKEDEKEQEMQEGQEEPDDYRQQEMAAIEKDLPEHQKWMARAMQKLEQVEQKEQKKLIKAQTHNRSVGQDEQNCW